MLASYVVLAVSLVAAANAYSTGAPESVCQDMVPKHPVPKQTSPPPYTITTSTKVRSVSSSKNFILTYFYCSEQIKKIIPISKNG